MSGLRACYPGFEYENYEDFCRRAPETIPQQVWIPGPPYSLLEDSVGTESKLLETDKNIGQEQEGLKMTITERKKNKPGVQASKEKKPSKLQQKPVKKTKSVKEEKLHVKVEKNSKKEQKPVTRESRKKKEEKLPKETAINKNESKSRTPRAKKPKDKLEVPEKMIVDAIVKKVPSGTRVTKIKLSTSQSL